MADKPTDRPPPAVLAAISAVAEEINKTGIAKDSQASGGGISFKFRGIDATLDTFSGMLARAKMRVLASYSELEILSRPTASGNVTYHAQVKGTYRALSLVDGTEVALGDYYGEANDTMDKAIAKAQSIALRQAYLQTWSVPLGAEYDPESGDSSGKDVEEPKAQTQPAAKQDAKPAAKPVEGEVVNELTPNQVEVIESTARTRKVKMGAVRAAFPAMNSGNINDILAWIKKPPVDNNA